MHLESRRKTLDAIISHMEHPSKEDRDLIEKAYAFAEDAHEGQTRHSGEPYVSHAGETAIELARLSMGPHAIAAGLLHDVIEDAGIGEEVIREEFGEDVRFLVAGVTKLGHLHYHGLKRHTESLRKLFVAMAEDIRVLIIKLADRLHNVRTLEHVPDPEKRKRIALETLEVYAPLAHRLGMGRLKGELEDASFAHADPEAYRDAERIHKERRVVSVRALEHVTKELLRVLAKNDVSIVKTDQRVKHLYSFWKKMKRSGMNADAIYDIAALRVIVPTLDDCYRALGAIHSVWKPLPGRVKDYIASPKLNGYRSLHTTVFTGEDGIVEIQIRTPDMHRDAELGIASHVGYKEGSGTTRLGSLFALFTSFARTPKRNATDENTGNEATFGKEVPHWVTELAALNDVSETSEEFLSNMKRDFFDVDMFVFTPKGEVVGLSNGSSPIDFAYAIHTDIGNHTAGAKVNGKLVSLDTALSHGDIVEIITKESSKPTQKWLTLAKTAVARRKIAQALSSANKT